MRIGISIVPSAARYQHVLGETVLGFTRPFRQSGLVLSPFPPYFIGLNCCSIFPSSSVPNLAKRSLLFMCSGWVKGDPLIPFLFRLRFSSALRDGIGVFKPSSPSTKKKCFFYTKRPPSPSKTWSFAWKIENRPTIGDFEIYFLDPQLHQTFKPIRKFSCTFLPI